MRYQFNPKKWEARTHTPGGGTYIVEGVIKGSSIIGKVVATRHSKWKVGQNISVRHEGAFDRCPPRDSKGRFKKAPKLFKAFVRQISVVPVLVEAYSLAQAERNVLNGGGEYLYEEEDVSDLDAREELEELFEKPTEEMLDKG